MKRILVRMTGTHPGAKLGDFLMATPALAGLRLAHPDAEITLLLGPPQTGPCFADPALFNNILWDDAEKADAGLRGSYRLLRQIQERRFDAFVALNSRSHLAWICRLANIPRRIGSTGKYHRALYTENVAQDRGSPDRHEIEFNYDLMRPLGVSGTPGPMIFPVTPEAEAEAERLLCAARLDAEQPCIVLNPTYGGSSRALPADCFAQAARRLNCETGLPILLVGGAQDAAENACLARTIGVGVHDLTGKTSVAVLAALLRQSALHISIDTGTMHLAAAMKTPCLTVFPFMEHWEQRVRWRPWQTEQRLIGPRLRCSDCVPGKCRRTQNVCLDSIQPVEIAEAALELLIPPDCAKSADSKADAQKTESAR